MRIVVVDDERLIAFTLSQILTLHGYRVSWFQSPLVALEHVKADRPDLVISDVMMSEMNGIELARELATHVPECELILFSAVPVECPSSRQFLQKQRIRTLTKPLAITDLLSQVRAVAAVSTKPIL